MAIGLGVTFVVQCLSWLGSATALVMPRSLVTSPRMRQVTEISIHPLGVHPGSGGGLPISVELQRFACAARDEGRGA